MSTTTVLLVDDEVTILQGLRRLYDWEANDFRIVGEAVDGISAVNMARKLRPDIVLMDINMPLLSGLDAVEQMSHDLPDTVVIIISGYSDAHYMRRAIRHRVFDYIIKPVTPEVLSEALGRARLHLVRGNRAEKAPVPSAEQTTIAQMVAYLNAHLSEEVSLRVLADMFHMNASYISQYFKRETGMNYSAYLSMLRVNRAKVLLRGTDMNVGEVAQQTGFGDYRAFSRTFKQIAGVTPSQYRASLKI